MQDEVIMEELTESGKLTDDYIASLVPVRKQHESTQFVSVLSIGLHEEDDIDSEQNEILSMIKDELNSLGLKKKKKRDGSGKKRIRGLPETDFVMLMEDTEWHLSGQGYVVNVFQRKKNVIIVPNQFSNFFLLFFIFFFLLLFICELFFFFV